MEIFTNFPFWAAASAIFFAQFIKVPIHYLLTKETDWTLISSTGGMPSSHSAAVTSLATGVALEHGTGSTLFAISAVLAMIVMYDAKGIRRQAGEHAAVLNRLTADFEQIRKESKTWRQSQSKHEIKKLKELLGHKPIEVFFGGLTGVIWALILYTLLF
ncbi:divergent PAP2 family protein [Bacillus sp. FJAT-50079]|uniref:divergent PAP2 family protein n=1 Tax=Bacillus sp. FJAT-50079 TaxID=2833577 RepID=UPI001BC8E0BE|nr:divergent PAP2 family protein [Bacillus sp. FJAT-50079]MBS4208543.1 divergent PAP2 family protein [Bacillus sp. FJAT-50079]